MTDISIATTISDLAGGFAELFLPIAGGLLVLLLRIPKEEPRCRKVIHSIFERAGRRLALSFYRET